VPAVRLPGAPGVEVPRAALFAAIAIAGIGLLAVILPEPPDPPTLCLFKLTTGHPCPACGFLRAARLLVRGDVPGAFVANPLGAALMLLAPPAALAWAMPQARARGAAIAASRRARVTLWWLLGAAGAANWVYVLAVGR